MSGWEGCCELTRRADRLIDRRIKQASFRPAGKTLDSVAFRFNRKINRKLIFELANGRFIDQREDTSSSVRPAPARAI